MGKKRSSHFCGLNATAQRWHDPLEAHAYPAVDVASFERCPRINGHSAVGGARRQFERLPSGLPHTGQVLAVQKDPPRAELAFGKHADDRVRLATLRIRIRFE